MKKLLFALIFICSLSVFGQEPTYRQVVTEYLNVNGTTQQYQQAIDQLFDLLKQQFKDQEVQDSDWSALRKDAQPAIQQIKAMLVSAYRGSFEKEEIQEMLEFYKTNTGKQLLLDQTAMTEDQKQKAAVFYNSPTGQKILTSQGEISRRVGEVSEIWSRDLYRGMIDKLAEKGFILQQ